MAATVLLAMSTSVISAFAQMQAPQPIATPIGEPWRTPFAAFLKTLGIKDPAGLLVRTYVFDIGLLRPGTIGVRVEDESTCHKDQCFTIIGRIHNKRFVADAMFSAGKRFTRSDHAIPLFGSQTFPAWFVGDALTVTALETERGWLIVPGLVEKQPPPSPRGQ
jgi:hypothetical protein